MPNTVPKKSQIFLTLPCSRRLEIQDVPFLRTGYVGLAPTNDISSGACKKSYETLTLTSADPKALAFIAAPAVQGLQTPFPFPGKERRNILRAYLSTHPPLEQVTDYNFVARGRGSLELVYCFWAIVQKRHEV